jgi:hypothetical protein
VAWVAASAALYACALMVASTRQRDALSPAGVTIATLVYVSFAVVLIVRWPPWLLAALSTAGAVASMAAGTPDLLVGPGTQGHRGPPGAQRLPPARGILAHRVHPC